MFVHSRGEGATEEEEYWGDGSEFIDDGSIWMGLTNQDEWAGSGQIRYEWIGVDGPKGHVVLTWSLCGLQGILNGNDLCLTINPNP